LIYDLQAEQFKDTAKTINKLTRATAQTGTATREIYYDRLMKLASYDKFAAIVILLCFCILHVIIIMIRLRNNWLDVLIFNVFIVIIIVITDKAVEPLHGAAVMNKNEIEKQCKDRNIKVIITHNFSV